MCWSSFGDLNQVTKRSTRAPPGMHIQQCSAVLRVPFKHCSDQQCIPLAHFLGGLTCGWESYFFFGGGVTARKQTHWQNNASCPGTGSFPRAGRQKIAAQPLLWGPLTRQPNDGDITPAAAGCWVAKNASPAVLEQQQFPLETM